MQIKEYIDPKTGEIAEIHPAMVAPVARDPNRLYADGSEKLCNVPLVSPLSRQPSLRDRIKNMVRSGELAQAIREAQNLMDDDDENYEGFDRNHLDEVMPTPTEYQTYLRHKPSEEPQQAPEEAPQPQNEPSATTLPDPKEGDA